MMSASTMTRFSWITVCWQIPNTTSLLSISLNLWKAIVSISNQFDLLPHNLNQVQCQGFITTRSIEPEYATGSTVVSANSLVAYIMQYSGSIYLASSHLIFTTTGLASSLRYNNW
jgi:hypothetical protein